MFESSSELSPQSSSPSHSQTSSLHSVLLQTNSSARQANDPANKRFDYSLYFNNTTYVKTDLIVTYIIQMKLFIGYCGFMDIWFVWQVFMLLI